MSSDPKPTFEEDANNLCRFGRRLLEDRLAYGTAGNLSCRLGSLVAITPSSTRYDDLTPHDIWLMGLDGSIEVAGKASPSSELPLHLAVYASTPALAVVHTHSAEVVALSTVPDELPAIHYSIIDLGGPVPVVAYSRFGSAALAEGASSALTSHSAVILQNHGAVTYGKSLAQAYERALLLEWLASTYRRALQLGVPRILSEQELSEVAAEAHRRRYASGGA